MGLGDEKFVLITTFRRDGTAVPTPVWAVPLDGGRFGFTTSSTTGKVKRLAHTQRVLVQPCSRRGQPTPGTSPVDATAAVVTGARRDEIRTRLRAKYGFQVTIAGVVETVAGIVKRRRTKPGDAGIVVTPDDVTSTS